jgi:hypothetical protein
MSIVVAVLLFSCIAGPSLLAAGAPVAPAPTVFNYYIRSQTAPTCSSRIIVTLVQRLDGDPDDAFVSSLAAAAGIQLAYLWSAGPGLYVFALSGSESDSRCHDSMERLRRDPRVRSVEIDARRKPHTWRL